MKRFQKLSRKVLDKMSNNKIVVGASALLATTASQAAVAAPDFTTNIADLAIILGAAIAFGALVWGARKLLSFIG